VSKTNGYQLCEELRSVGENIPILMVTANQEAENKHKGFRVGTDDYLTKPFDSQEMLFRIKALLRRAQIANKHKIIIGKTLLDYSTLSVTRNGEEISLPKKEFQLIFLFLSYPNKIFTRLQLIENIWGSESETDDHTLNVHINRLRSKFRDNPDFNINTAHGLGYKSVITHEMD
jgi:two-component system OmpR family response regulator